jgi:hypothetical protein
MKFYQDDKGNWHSVNNYSSRYWEINKGFHKYRMVEITADYMVGFGWQKGEHVKLTNEQFKEFLQSRKKYHSVMLSKINNLLKELK